MIRCVIIRGVFDGSANFTLQLKPAFSRDCFNPPSYAGPAAEEIVQRVSEARIRYFDRFLEISTEAREPSHRRIAIAEGFGQIAIERFENAFGHGRALSFGRGG